MSHDTTTLFLCGDVMLGRGIDQIRQSSVDPALHEPWVRDARRYVTLADETNGPIPRAVDATYVWGDVLAELDRVAPDVRLINLETAITARGTPWPAKSVHYRMHPANVDALTAARIDMCALANNHVLDYGTDGLIDTLDALESAGIRVAGAGRDWTHAGGPVTVERGEGARIIVFSFGCANSGIPEAWAAGSESPGVAFLADLSSETTQRVADGIAAAAGPGNTIIASIHWGSNWGYEVPSEFRRFAHRLIDAGAAVVHGHSSHHPRPIELYKDRLILYGCGDFVTDYEGIDNHRECRPDLTLMYFATLASTGELLDLRITVMHLRKFQLTFASAPDAEWVAITLSRVSAGFDTRVDVIASREPGEATRLVLTRRSAV